MLQSMGLQRVGHDLGTEQQKLSEEMIQMTQKDNKLDTVQSSKSAFRFAQNS